MLGVDEEMVLRSGEGWSWFQQKSQFWASDFSKGIVQLS